MGRYRPPQARGLAYITPEGFAALLQEQKELWRKRRHVTVILSAAAAEGDRSENAEYIYRKKQLREIDRRLRYLDKRVAELKVVDAPPANVDRIYFGAWVTLEDEQGNEYRYRLVGADELDIGKGYISVDSPLGRALLNKSVDEEVTVQLPKGEQTYLVTEIRYAEAGSANQQAPS